ncbi:hypothetical protein C4D60_Mb08t17150 [Musa balbisiana]|uniref:Uncharacterized protein n=1 Tax=Musa balbisiana TaxID=52838 RepID=A0A4S8K4D6_MUSBA|nr:hypothetical protein C4D60_Mb08t17150 [Musa balbisiana]
MSLAKIVATTTINGLQESKREGWARQNDMANNMGYLELMKEKEPEYMTFPEKKEARSSNLTDKNKARQGGKGST